MKNISLTVNVWRQSSKEDRGKFVKYELSDLNKSIFNSYSSRNFINHPLSVYEDALSYIIKPMK